jgi:LEA14-like dessication related protein
MNIPVSPRALALLALVCAAIAGGCQSLQDVINAAPQPSAKVIGAELRDLKVNSVDMIFSVEVTNPYTTDLPVSRLAYVLDSRGTTLLEGGIEPTGAIPARGRSVLQLPARIDFDTLIATLKGVTPGSVVPWRADFIVALDAPVLGRIKLPLSRSGELPVPAMPEVEVVAFDLGSLSLDKASATTTLKVTNTNRFALDLKKLGFTLDLGDSPVVRTSLANTEKLGPGEATTIQVPVSFAPRAFGAALFNLLRGESASYRLTGSIEAGTAYAPLSAPFVSSGRVAIGR